jgi:hypothetical protein
LHFVRNPGIPLPQLSTRASIQREDEAARPGRVEHAIGPDGCRLEASTRLGDLPAPRELESADVRRGDLREGTPRYALSNLTDDERTQLSDMGYVVPTVPAQIDGEAQRLQFEVANLESFLNEIIHLQREMHIIDFALPPRRRE